MNVGVIIVGIGQWEEYTKPLVLSIKEHEPNATQIIVNNGCRYTSSDIKNSLNVFTCNVWKGLDTIKPVSYAEAINSGIKRAVNVFSYKTPDWIIITNNDVICNAPFIEYLESLDTNSLYGNKIHTSHKVFKSPTPWIDGWIYAIPYNILTHVGLWDKKFKIAGFEDADYCIRAYYKGFTTKKSNLPFTHLEEHIRKSFEDYAKYKRENIEYLIEKHGLERVK